MDKFKVLAGDFEDGHTGKIDKTLWQQKTRLWLLRNPRGKGKLFGAKWVQYSLEDDVAIFGLASEDDREAELTAREEGEPKRRLATDQREITHEQFTSRMLVRAIAIVGFVENDVLARNGHGHPSNIRPGRLLNQKKRCRLWASATIGMSTDEIMALTRGEE